MLYFLATRYVISFITFFESLLPSVDVALNVTLV